MSSTATTPSAPHNPALRAILLGGFLAGFADFLFATIRAVMAGNPALRPWKSVASGLLGPTAREGGIGMAVLGVSLHFFICFAAAALLYSIVSRVKWIPRQWIILGMLYGIAFLAVMNYVILPLSAIDRSIYPLSQMHINAFWHIVLVGLPTSFFISRGVS